MSHCIVDIDESWRIIELARSDAGANDGRFDVDAVAEALTVRLTALSPEEILDFADRYFDLRDRLDQWQMCAACLLITGYISNDAFDKTRQPPRP